MATQSGIRIGAEVAATRVALWILPRLSRRGLLRLARVLGRLGYRLSGHMRRTGMANLDLAFGSSKSAEEKDRILRGAFEAFALTILDVFWFSRDIAERMRKHIVFDADFREKIFCDRAQVLLTGHYGNWEVLGQFVAHAGMPVMSVAAPLANEAVDALFLSMRRASGQQVVAKEGAMLKLLRHLRRGGKVAMLLDQNTKAEDGGVFVDFFGLPVPVSMAAAALALRTGCEIRFGTLLPDSEGNYHGRIVDAILPEEFGNGHDRGVDETRALTQRITSVYERIVREHPEHWLWMYKRWKHIPPGRGREGYPFYSKLPRA